ncbi:GNAT family N-acetyltransferase [Pontibacter sp. MBLB2868]|uniref:GNAT family N-acetyltransferase n=1 Tax=Pontibacter sp. MBLB2868 TaxID=3451555 RepID=UPI003F754ECB
MKTKDQVIKIEVAQYLLLREIAVTDAPAIFNLIDSNRTYLREWLPFVDYTLAVSDTESYIKSAQASYSDLVFVIIYQQKHVGVIGYKGIDLINQKLEIGYWLAERQQGKGIVTRCCKALIRYAFEQMKMNRVQLKVALDNQKSKKIPLRLGFKTEGIERDGELSSNGEYHDLEVYSLLKREWQ